MPGRDTGLPLILRLQASCGLARMTSLVLWHSILGHNRSCLRLSQLLYSSAFVELYHQLRGRLSKLLRRRRPSNLVEPSLHPSPRCFLDIRFQMAQDAAPAADAIAQFTEYSPYGEYTILVPEQFSPDDSTLLMRLQVLAIDVAAIFKVERDTMVNVASFTTTGAPCTHINFSPISRDKFDYSAFTPLSLIEKNGLVVAGVCVTSLKRCRLLAQLTKPIPSSVDKDLGLLLQRYVYLAYVTRL